MHLMVKSNHRSLCRIQLFLLNSVLSLSTHVTSFTLVTYKTLCYFLILSPVNVVFQPVKSFFFSPKHLLDQALTLSLYLEDDSAANHSGGDVLLFVSHPLDLAELAVQLSVNVGEHGPHGAAGYVEDILTADDQESQQHEAEEELCHQGPHRPTFLISREINKPKHDNTLLPPHAALLSAERKANSCSLSATGSVLQFMSVLH